jgi:primosomal replication protein N
MKNSFATHKPVSILSSPKPWSGIALQSQENAVKSWLTLHPDIEVILYGDAPGTAEACKRLGVQHVPDIAATPQGVPYFGAIADHAAIHARHDLQCYVNCDILFAPGLIEAARCMAFTRFLMIGQRIDLAEGVMITMRGDDWPRQLLALSETGAATLHTSGGSDYFIFQRGMWRNLPPVVIGRGGYDNALIAFCLKKQIPVIDATISVLALHQFHDYGHVKGGASEVFDGQIALFNLANIPVNSIPTLDDAGYLLINGRLVNNYCRGDWLRYYYMKFCYRKISVLPDTVRLLWRLQIKLRMRRQWAPTISDILAERLADTHQAVI